MISEQETAVPQRLLVKFLTQINRENILKNREFLTGNRDFYCKNVSVHFSHPFPLARKHDLFLLSICK